MQKLLRQLRHAANDQPGDADLLDAFRQRGDVDALARLIERHSGMVLGVCRRVLGDADADDAFQATFLVLLRRAADVRPASRVGVWLHGVAQRTALAAKIAGARRQRLLRRKPESSGGVSIPEFERDELRRIIDRELDQLPESYRSAIVLCDLEGRARKEVAAELGWPEGTLSCRLARGRKLLADRLVRAGIAPAAAGIALTEVGTSAASVPKALLTTIREWLHDPNSASEVVRFLADEVGKSMTISTAKWFVAAGFVVILGSAVAFAAQWPRDRSQRSPDDKPNPPQRAEPVQKPKPGPAWRLILERDDRRFAVNLDDETQRDLPVSRGSFGGGALDPTAEKLTVSFSASPDGKRAVYEMTHPRLGRRNGMLAVTDIDGSNFRDLGDSKQCYNPIWSPDGKRIVFLSDRHEGQWHLFSISPDATKDDAERLTTEPVTFNCKPCFAFDGRLIYTIARKSQSKAPAMDLVIRDGDKETRLVEKNYVIDFSTNPQRSKIAYIVLNELFVHDLKTGTQVRQRMTDVNANWSVCWYGLLWRPDGEALAATFGFLGGRMVGKDGKVPLIPGEDYIGIVSLDGPKPTTKTYKVGQGCRLYAWAKDEDLQQRK